MKPEKRAFSFSALDFLKFLVVFLTTQTWKFSKKQSSFPCFELSPSVNVLRKHKLGHRKLDILSNQLDIVIPIVFYHIQHHKSGLQKFTQKIIS